MYTRLLTVECVRRSATVTQGRPVRAGDPPQLSD
jgi:hypothetical protein